MVASTQPTATALKLESELARPGRLGPQNLHPYRLKVKELSNVLRLAKEPGDKDFINTLSEAKDGIGEWHDWEELLAISGKVLDHSPNCKIQRELKRTAKQKYARALSLAEQVRKQCFAVSLDQGKRARNRSNGPVGAATSLMDR
jgi:hypothetical protein